MKLVEIFVSLKVKKEVSKVLPSSEVAALLSTPSSPRDSSSSSLDKWKLWRRTAPDARRYSRPHLVRRSEEPDQGDDPFERSIDRQPQEMKSSWWLPNCSSFLRWMLRFLTHWNTKPIGCKSIFIVRVEKWRCGRQSEPSAWRQL